MEAKQDDLRWFGEGFDGFPKTLPEDCVVYTVYIIDSTLKDVQIRDQLRQAQSAASKITKTLLKNFIWQREPFQLSLERHRGQSFLRGSTNYGDSVEDEWLIVFLLRELSKQFPQIWIRVVDTDGQFLLIEAANVLPLWLNPEIAEFRVWIKDAKLLIIPLDKPGGKRLTVQSESDDIGLEEAMAYLQRPQPKLLHSTKIETEAFSRLQKYPQQITESLHHAVVNIPRKLAYILHNNAACISPAVEAFYLRDPIALRPLQAKSPEKLIIAPTDTVSMSIRFTKVGYAQLKSQHFTAPASWAEPVSKAKPVERSKAEMGMKISCGFEMLLSDPQNKDKKIVREIKLLLDDLDEGDVQLPSDVEIRDWGMQDDDESWLDINFEDFEKELEGKRGTSALGRDTGFGDKSAQENLRKMVAKFEEFLNDDDAGSDDLEYDEMDNDDDDEVNQSSMPTEDIDDEIEGMDPEFDEDEFTSMMREMMGMPPDVMKEMMGKPEHQSSGQRNKSNRAQDAKGQGASPPTNASDDGNEGIRQAMEDTETELREAGVFDLDPGKEGTIEPLNATSSTFRDISQPSTSKSDSAISQKDHENEQYILAKNLLESFKSQGGKSGPAGNLIGLMNVHLPRDEGGADET